MQAAKGRRPFVTAHGRNQANQLGASALLRSSAISAICLRCEGRLRLARAVGNHPDSVLDASHPRLRPLCFFDRLDVLPLMRVAELTPAVQGTWRKLQSAN